MVHARQQEADVMEWAVILKYVKSCKCVVALVGFLEILKSYTRMSKRLLSDKWICKTVAKVLLIKNSWNEVVVDMH